jgi:hypothetical protein
LNSELREAQHELEKLKASESDLMRQKALAKKGGDFDPDELRTRFAQVRQQIDCAEAKVQ